MGTTSGKAIPAGVVTPDVFRRRRRCARSGGIDRRVQVDLRNLLRSDTPTLDTQVDVTDARNDPAHLPGPQERR
jgi:hypothetical protein